MSEELKVKLLGPPAAFVGDEPVKGFVSIKARALLYFLAATGEAHRRDVLAPLLWSNVPDATARKNLRDVLFNLRQLIGPFLIITRHRVGLNPDAPTKIDSQFLLQTVTAVRSRGTATATASTSALKTLAQAADPRKGEFLAGFYAPDAPLFEEWMLAEREHLRLELGHALQSLTEYSLAFGDYAAAETYARRQLELDSYREEAHRQLMTTLALSDRRAEAAAHYEALVDLLWNELGLEPAQKTQDLFAKIQAGETIPVKYAGKFETPPDNLPEPLTPFVGRKKELVAIANQLAAPNCHLLTLHGPGGAGKTRLALEFARQLRGQYAEGIFFVPLASLSSSTDLVTTIAAAIGLQLRPSPKPLKQLLQFLKSRQMLLLLDNFEHLKEGAVLLVDMLQTASQLTILVASRDRLQLAAENLFEVSGLRTDPANDETTEKGPEAVQMFEIYAQRVRHDFRPDDAESRAVADLCRLVEGMPLAIELAAAWVLEVSPMEILQRIAAGSRLLETEYADVPPRLRSVRASFNYSWELLNEEEQQALMRLSVFRGGCTLASATPVVGAGSGTLASLVDKSLLTYDPATGRYHIHELIRQFAAEKLETNNTDYESAHNRHSAYYAAFLHQMEEDTVGWNMLKTFDIIGEENDNIFAALDWAITQKDETVFEQATESLIQYLPYPAMERQGESILEHAVTALTGSTERGIGVHYPRLSPKLYSLVGFLIAIQGFLMTRIGSPEEAQELLEQGVALQDTSNPRHKRRLAKSKFYLGWNLYLQGKNQEAVSETREALALFSDLEYPHGMAASLFQLGRASYQRGQFAEAEKLLAKSRKLSDKFGFSIVGGHSCWAQAMIAIKQGSYSRAMDLLNRNLALHRDVGTYMDLAVPIRERGRLYLILGRFGRAQEDLDQSMLLYREHGNTWFYDVNLNITADFNRLQGNYEKAEQLFNRGLSAAREVNDQKLTALFLSGLGTVAYDQGQYAKAEQLQLEALDLVRKPHNDPEIASILRYLGHATMALGKDGYKQYYLEALQLAETHRLAPVALDVMVGIAQLYSMSGKELEAIELLTMVTGHESSTYETKINAANIFEMVAADMDEEMIAFTQSRGRERDLWEITRKLLSNGL